MTTGFWEPHTSSVDFCEANYLHFNHVVEWHNAWSSLFGLSSFGLIGIIYNNPTKEIRTFLAYLILVLIGLGSTGLHGSLHWIFQSSDELPMLYVCNVLNFSFMEHDAPQGKPNYPMLPYLLALWSILQTVFYYRFQHIYIIFLLVYTVGVVIILFNVYRIVVERGHRRGPISRKLGFTGVFSFCCVGFPVWVLDMHYCHAVLNIADTLLPGLWKGMTPHVLWHFASGFGCYCAAACLTACRLEELKIPFQLEYMFGIVPITTVIKGKGGGKLTRDD